jgi:hypothetical protein
MKELHIQGPPTCEDEDSVALSAKLQNIGNSIFPQLPQKQVQKFEGDLPGLSKISFLK